MLLGVASFAIAVISLLIAIFSFILGERGHPRIRLVLGVPCLLATILFGLIGFFSFFGSVSFPPVNGGGSDGQNCTATPHTQLAQGDHSFAGSVHVVELWRANGQSPWGDKLVTAVVLGDVTIVGAGGSVWTYPAGCEDTARREVAEGAGRTGAQVVTEANLRDAGMIK